MNSRTAEKLVNGNIEVTIPIYIRRESNLVTLDRLPETPKTEWQRLAPLQRRLVLGFHLLDKCEENPSKSSVAIAKEESMDRSLFYKTLSLVNLAPDIVEEIMSDPPTFDFSGNPRIFLCSFQSTGRRWEKIFLTEKLNAGGSRMISSTMSGARLTKLKVLYAEWNPICPSPFAGHGQVCRS